MATQVRTSAAGMQIGKSASEKVGFYGAAPVAQRAGAAGAAVAATAPTNSTPYGFSQQQATDLIALVNEMRATLVALGLHKGAA